jgi:Tfp pilus assembly protein PilN
MAQQINLYPQGRERRRRVFSRVGSAVVLLAFGAGVAAWSYVESRRLASLREEVKLVGGEVERLQRLLTQVPSPAASLTERLAAEEKAVIALEQVAIRLTAGSLGNGEGFASRLRALAQVPVDGVWLTEIRVDHAGGSLAVEGRALDAALVPTWISGLKRVPLLAETAFAAIDLRALENSTYGGKPVQFRLNSAPSRGAVGAGGAAVTAAVATAGAAR